MINAASHEMKPVERVSQSGATTKLKLNTETQKEGEEEELLENLLSHSSVCPARRKDKENYLFYVLSQTFQSDFPTQIQVMTPWGAEKKNPHEPKDIQELVCTALSYVPQFTNSSKWRRSPAAAPAVVQVSRG